jgi:pimeloyl-ACP methyl ester carboxylesterase
MKSIDRDGVRLAYEETAGGGSPPILFVPGGSCDWWSFHEQLDHFAPRHHVASLDLRGHGQSDTPDEGFDIATYTDDVAWFIDRLGMDRPIVVGHSMGGAIALQLAASHPDLTRAVVLVDPAPVYDNQAGFQAMLDAMERHGVDSTRRRVFTSFFLEGHDPAIREEVCVRAAVVDDRVFAGEVASLRDWDGHAAALACAVPVLHIAAAQPACSPSRLRAVLPGVVTGQTVGAGHFNMLEVPDQVNSMMENFLTDHVTT